MKSELGKHLRECVEVKESGENARGKGGIERVVETNAFSVN